MSINNLILIRANIFWGILGWFSRAWLRAAPKMVKALVLRPALALFVGPGTGTWHPHKKQKCQKCIGTVIRPVAV